MRESIVSDRIIVKYFHINHESQNLLFYYTRFPFSIPSLYTFFSMKHLVDIIKLFNIYKPTCIILFRKSSSHQIFFMLINTTVNVICSHQLKCNILFRSLNINKVDNYFFVWIRIYAGTTY